MWTIATTPSSSNWSIRRLFTDGFLPAGARVRRARSRRGCNHVARKQRGTYALIPRKESFHATVRPHPDQRQYRSGHPQGGAALDLRRVVSDITADGGVALELSQNSDVTRSASGALFGAADWVQQTAPGDGMPASIVEWPIFRPTESSSRRRRMGSMRPSTVEFQ
jgi:hypothetical protein